MDNTATAPDPAAESSLSDHEQSFGPQSRSGDVPPPAQVVTERADDGLDPPDVETEAQKAERARDDKGQFTRQRAKSQRAGADDVETINALTRRIREAEEKLGVKVERQDGEKDRVYTLRRRAELLEAKIERTRETAQRVPPLPNRPPPKKFEEKEPVYEDFANEPDQYAAWMRAMAGYDRRKEAHEQQATGYKTQTEAAIKARNDARDRWHHEQFQNHSKRLDAFYAKHPDAEATINDSGVVLTPAMQAAIVSADNGPELMLRLAENPDLADDVFILTRNQPLSQDLVASVQRRLNRGLTAGTTGSASVPPPKVVPAVPRPPNPVRTGPIASADTPPGDEGSLADHEKFFGRKRR